MWAEVRFRDFCSACNLRSVQALPIGGHIPVKARTIHPDHRPGQKWGSHLTSSSCLQPGHSPQMAHMHPRIDLWGTLLWISHLPIPPAPHKPECSCQIDLSKCISEGHSPVLFRLSPEALTWPTPLYVIPSNPTFVYSPL